MSTVGELCAEIAAIRIDIAKMEIAKVAMGVHKANFEEKKKDVDDYDMTVGDTWKKDLCDGAVAIQGLISTAIQDSEDNCDEVISDLNTCIDNAYAKIDELQDEIDDLLDDDD